VKKKRILLQKIIPDLYTLEIDFWNQNKSICGIDEVGRGCLAGPIVTAAIILDPNKFHPKLNDSKLLSPLQLENIYYWLLENSKFSIGISDHRLIDNKNIYKTTLITMKKALYHLLQSIDSTPDLIAVDAMPLNLTNSPFENIAIESWIKGESKSASIAAASIVAKVTRDRILQKMSPNFPVFNLEKHKGYGTSYHIQALKHHGASIMHRKTFIKNFQGQNNDETTIQQNLFC